MLRLELTKRALRFLERLPAKQFRQIMRRILALASDPAPPDSKLLKGAGLRVARSGEYRIVYEVIPEGVLRIIVVGKRNDAEVYRRL